MASPWHSTLDFPLNTSSDPKKSVNFDLGSIHNEDRGKEKNSINSTLWSMNSLQNIFVKSNNLFKLPDTIKEKVNSDVEEDDEIENVYHTGLVNRAFLPMRLALIAVGRWPFPMRMVDCAKRKRKGHGHHHQHQYRYKKIRNYVPNLKSILWLYYGLTSLFILYVLLMSTLGFLNFVLDWEKIFSCCNWASHNNSSLFQNNLVLFLLIWGCFVHSTLSSFSFLVKRKKIVKILNYWNVVVDDLALEDVKPHRRFLIMANVGYLGFLILIYVVYSLKVKLVYEGSELLGRLGAQPILSLVTDDTDIAEKWHFRICGVVIMIYAIYASRCFLFLFSFKCRLLKSLIRVWNGRLFRFLKGPELDVNEEKGSRDRDLVEKRECERLLRDMAIILKIIKLTDKMFDIVLQAYYAIQLLNMCFELYMLAKSGSEEYAKSVSDMQKGFNVISSVVTLMQNLYFFFTISLDGARVGEEADKGMEILRRHAITPTSSIHKKYLVYNLSFIYSHRITVTGGKYFNIDRPFILTVLGAVLTYFVIIIQVGPDFLKKYTNSTDNTTTTTAPSV